MAFQFQGRNTKSANNKIENDVIGNNNTNVTSESVHELSMKMTWI